LQQERTHPGWCQDRARQASEFIRREYSPERERNDVCGLYARFLERVANGRK
jgi:hypothetical protein